MIFKKFSPPTNRVRPIRRHSITITMYKHENGRPNAKWYTYAPCPWSVTRGDRERVRLRRRAIQRNESDGNPSSMVADFCVRSELFLIQKFKSQLGLRLVVTWLARADTVTVVASPTDRPRLPLRRGRTRRKEIILLQHPTITVITLSRRHFGGPINLSLLSEIVTTLIHNNRKNVE